ncbi:MAG: ABC transporter permease subunit, partial [Panacagrimonas sp.]
MEKLASDDNDEKIAAIAALVAEGDPKAIDVLKQAAEGEVEVDGKKVEIVANNRVRGRIAEALSVLKLLSEDKGERQAAAKALAGGADAAMLPLILKAKQKEKDADIKAQLEMIAAGMQIKSEDKATRLAAIRMLGESGNPNARALLTEAASDTDAEIRAEAQRSLSGVQSRLVWGEWLGLAFAGVSLGSILLLAALGLAITYGLMGVINMAHGELMMIGAYATYVVQGLFQKYLPGAFDWYLLAAVPVAFGASALMGAILERGVIRFLYGRPLETLLATWGISLMLIQGVRTLFGAQNVQVENPAFMSGGIEALTGIVLPWSRIVIIGFAFAVLAGMWLMLTRTRLGLYVRGVT